jgi:hypothetical protein
MTEKRLLYGPFPPNVMKRVHLPSKSGSFFSQIFLERGSFLSHTGKWFLGLLIHDGDTLASCRRLTSSAE